MPGNSSQNVYVTPNAPLTPFGQDLQRILQQWVVGVSGLSGSFVRPLWQQEPANIPDVGDTWAAIGITETTGDAFPYIEHDPAGDGSDVVQNNETFVLATRWYGPDAGRLCATMVMSCAVPQNRDKLLPIKLIRVPDRWLSVPVLFKERWQNRIDMNIVMRRQLDSRYAIFNLTSAQGILRTDTTPPYQAPINVEQ